MTGIVILVAVAWVHGYVSGHWLGRRKGFREGLRGLRGYRRNRLSHDPLLAISLQRFNRGLRG